MRALRPGLLILCCATLAHVTLAAEPSTIDTATKAVTKAVGSAAKAADTAAKNAANALLPGTSKAAKAKPAKTPKPAATGSASATSDPNAAPKVQLKPSLQAGQSSPPAKTSSTSTPSEQKAPASKSSAAAAPAAKTASPPAKSTDKPAEGTKPGTAAAAAKGSWPKTIEDAKSEEEAKKTPQAKLSEWSKEDIELAKARCSAMLKGLDAVTLPEEPFRDGNCGAPAPVRLISIGKAPEVSFSPPALVSCDMVAALHKWITGDVQPAAKKSLGQSVIKIEVMSDYSCRAAYGRTGNKLSEHAYANALDLRGFITASGQSAHVLESWGETQRDINKRIAAAKAATEKAEAERLAAEQKAQANLRDPKAPATTGSNPTPPAAVATGSGAPAGGIARTTIIEGVPRLTVTLPGASPPGGSSGAAAAQPSAAFGAEPSRLGGPKSLGTAPLAVPAASKTEATAAAKTAPQVPSGGNKSGFLRQAHAAACRIFGTTLGPEANESHRNHFHLDMAQRKTAMHICD